MKQEMYDTWDIISLLILGAICGFLICLFLLVAKPSSSTEVWIAVSSVGTVTIPLVLFWWSQMEDKRKKRESQIRYDLEQMQWYIVKYIEPISKQLKKREEEIRENTNDGVRKRDIEPISVLLYRLRTFSENMILKDKIHQFIDIMENILKHSYYTLGGSTLYVFSCWFDELELMLRSDNFHQFIIKEMKSYEQTILFIYADKLKEDMIKSGENNE